MFNFFKWFRTEPEEDLEQTASSLFKVDNPNNSSVCVNNADYKTCFFGLNNNKKIYVEPNCEWVLELKDFNKSKPSILVVDDNPGIISFLLDDLYSLDGVKINLDEYNIITFDTINAAFYFEATQHSYRGLNIEYAIIDLTLGGSISTPKGPVKYTGVDIYQQILIYNPEVKPLFYTGNNLNEYIKSNEKIIEQFFNITDGKSIRDYVLFKTSLDLKDRREYLGKWFNK